MGGAHVRGEAVPRGEEQRRDREDRGGGAPPPSPRLPALPLQPDVFLLVVRAVSSTKLLRRQVVPQVGDTARVGWRALRYKVVEEFSDLPVIIFLKKNIRVK